tara:strand:+ start:158 stop:457 length:300 start_codon:yes stop_codon:yes gene_type:complete
VQIKTKKHFNEILNKLTLEVVEELEEMTVTADVDGYNTPFAFSGKKGKEKRKKISTNSTGYDIVNESLNEKDLKIIRKLVRDVVGDILRDIWLKRTAWK